MEPEELIAAAIIQTRNTTDPADRYRAASDLEQHLAEARVLVAGIRRDAIADMSAGGMGMTRIAAETGVSRTRVQQWLRQASAERASAAVAEKLAVAEKAAAVAAEELANLRPQ
jgi:transcriptional regulator with XRE-family HTH domain